MADEEETKTREKRKRAAKITESEKKRRKIQTDAMFHRSRVYLGSEQIRWATLKRERNLKTDREVATFLIDNYKKSHGKSDSHTQQIQRISSTPAQSAIARLVVEARTPSVSGVSGPESELEQHQLSGFEEMVKSEDSNGHILSGWSQNMYGVRTKSSKTGRPLEVKKLAASFMDPFDLSIDITFAETEESDDPDFEPSFTIEAVLPKDIDQLAEDVAYEEAEFGMEIDQNTVDEGNEEDEDATGPVQGITKVTTMEQCATLSQSTKCLVDLDQLKRLAVIHVEHCTTVGCSKSPKMVENFVGSAMYLKWVCEDGHISSNWCSQALLNKRLHSCDFLICATVLTSGNNFGKMALWADMLHLKLPSADQFHRIQSRYIVPTIDRYWANHQREILNSFRDNQVIVLVYRVRNLLAALDHNMNVNRAPLINKDGTLRLKRVWNKKSCRWSVYEEKEKKSYKYVDSIIEDALLQRINDKVGMRKRVMEAEDPRLLSKHLAPIEPPPTKEIHAAQVSRFK